MDIKKKVVKLTDFIDCWKSRTDNMIFVKDFTMTKDLYKVFKIRPLPQERLGDSMKLWSDVSGVIVSKPKGKYNCQICRYVLGCSKTWRKHMLQHEEKSPDLFECAVCGLCFKNLHGKKNSLESHMHMRHLYTYECRKCRAVFYNRNQAAYHYDRCPKKKYQKVRKRLYCNMCVFSTEDGDGMLYDHQLRQHGYVRLPSEAQLHSDPSLRCEQCNIYFRQRVLLNLHCSKEGHGHVEGMDVVCHDCGEITQSKVHLAAHRAAWHSTEEPMKCRECDQYFSKLWQFKAHMASKHGSNDETRICEHCGKVFTKSAFMKHIVLHRSGKDVLCESLRCRFCFSKCNSVSHYISHMLFNHTLKPYCCTLCGSRYQSRSDARDHILKSHAPVKPYTCEACNRDFAHLDYLNDHCVKFHQVNVKKTDKSLFLTKRMLGKIYTYEHVQIDGSLIEESILSKANVELCDYMEETNEPIDYQKAFFFDSSVDFNKPTKLPVPTDKRPKPAPGGEVKEAEPIKKKKKKTPKKTLEENTDTNNKLVETNRMGAPKVIVRTNKLIETNEQPARVIAHPVKPIKIKFTSTYGKLKDMKIEPIRNKSIQSNNNSSQYILGTLNDTDEFKTEINTVEHKLEETLDMPDLNFELNKDTPDVIEEEVIESKIKTKEEEEVESLHSMEVEEFIENSEEQPMQTVGEQSQLTEDILGELVEHEGQYYVMMEGQLYKIEN